MHRGFLISMLVSAICQTNSLSEKCWSVKVGNVMQTVCYHPPPPALPPLIGCNGCNCTIPNTTKCQQCFDVRVNTNDTSCLTQPSRQCLYHDSCTNVKVFEAPYIKTRSFCCAPLTPGNFGKLTDINDNTYERIDNGASPVQYRKFDINFAPWVKFDSEESAIFNADNQYTNYTCVKRNCRLAVVYRTSSAYDCTNSDAMFYDGSCIVRHQDTRDDSLSLCHNSTNAVCGVWIPGERSLTDAELIVSLMLFNALIISALVAFGFFWFRKLDDKYSALVPLIWAAALLVMGNLALIFAWEMREYAAKNHVDMPYVSYQGCWQYCTSTYENELDKARRIGCHDRGISCGETLTDDYCKSCQKAKDEHLKLHDASIHLTVVVFVRATAFWFAVVFKNINVSIAATTFLFGAWITNFVYLTHVLTGGERAVAEWAIDFGKEPLFSLHVAWTIMGIIECVFCMVVAMLQLQYKYTPYYVKPRQDPEDPAAVPLVRNGQ